MGGLWQGRGGKQLASPSSVASSLVGDEEIKSSVLHGCFVPRHKSGLALQQPMATFIASTFLHVW